METAITAGRPEQDVTGAMLRWAGVALMGVVWISSAIFGAYIVAFFGGALQDGALERWNESLPRLYKPDSLIATAGIGVHFAAGAILLLAGPVQFIGAIRRRAPALHRWTGRLYVGSAILAGVGGLTHILLGGTIGGMTMNVGFGIYGALMILCGVQALRHAMARRISIHREWAIRLFALAIGSWLYRVEYGLWSAFTNNAGHTETFDGWFDIVMIFFFYVPNLIVAELYIRSAKERTAPVVRAGASVVLLAVAGLVAYSTYFFVLYAWGPPIAARFI